MPNQLDVVIQPIVVRFSIQDGEIIYHFAGSAEGQLDNMERLMGIDPSSVGLFDSNLGYLPVSTTVLIRGEKNILVDPGNYHTGFYGHLGLGLKKFGLTLDDIDAVIVTHCHHDHMSSTFKLKKAQIYIGAGELEFAAGIYGKPGVNFQLGENRNIVEVPLNGILEVIPGVQIISTPGHTPGHVSVLVDTGTESILVTGDAIMTQREYEFGEHSIWYSGQQLEEIKSSRQRLQLVKPSIVMPGHDRGFRPGSLI
jgi:glyoxylase-like metal-dependent hydrolase (beta-lactamase superfamily II)